MTRRRPAQAPDPRVMSAPVSRRRDLLRGALLAGAAAACPALLAGCATAQTDRRSFPDASELSLERRIAQMLLIGFRAIDLTDADPIARDLRQYGIGGVILFDYDAVLECYQRDIASPEQLAALTASLREDSALPLLVAIDQEGGRVSRLKESYGFPPTVSARSLGRGNDLAATRRHAELTAATLRAAGINVNFAPVVDLDVNPDNPVIGRVERSFSADPAVVVAHAREVVLAHDRQGVATCLKHFPGHGSSTADSHFGLADVSDTWSEAELEPYRVLIDEGSCRMVMTAHIYNRRLDPVYPATLSHATVTGLLRERLGFDGVVVSDDLQMGAIRQNYAFETAIEKAILAGVDVLDICNESVYDPDVAPRTIELVTRLVREGAIGEARIDQSCRRIAKLKRALASPPA